MTFNDVTFLQNKIFANKSEDIASKTIYTIYSADYKDIFTPVMIKEVYNNIFEKIKIMKA